MLLELKIKDLAIISSTTLQFGEGLHVFTGETGAGKSILLAALNLVLGGRGDRGKIRSGQTRAWVEALFTVQSSVEPLLRSWGIEADPMEPLALRRIIHRNGRSRAYINSTSVPASHLRTLAPLLVSFGRQHDQNTLLHPNQHLELLDRFAGCEKERRRVEKKHQHLDLLLREHEELEEQHTTRQERLEFLQYQYDAIQEVGPLPGEWDELTEELAQLSSSEEEKKRIEEVEGLLMGCDDAIQTKLSSAIQVLEKCDSMGSLQEEVVEELERALFAIEESARSLKGYQRRLDSFPHRSKEIEERLEELHQLHEKYGGNWDAVFARLEQLEEEIQQLHRSNARVRELLPLMDIAEEELVQSLEPLTQKRHKAAKTMATQLEAELADLAMPGARFQVAFQPLLPHEGISCIAVDEGDSDTEIVVNVRGAERAAFLLAANPGEDLRPLERVASGGELSRILLALKRVLTHLSEVSTLVFDEIDAGVSGAAATQIAQKLRQIVEENVQRTDTPSIQIICITHTPQIAAEADHHFLIQKAVREGRTISSVTLMEEEQRVGELARMLAGRESNEQALELARKLLLKPATLAIAS